MQTLTSQWGQQPLEVADCVPTRMLRFKLGRTHVGTSDLEVARMIVAAMGTARADAPDAWTRQVQRETLQAGLWLHRENRREYGGVMSGRF
jgi:hypothetical protein